MSKRFVGIKDNRISIIANNDFNHNGLKVLPILDSLDNVSNNDLLLHYVVKNDQIVLHNAKKKAKELKVAFVGNFKMSCGISTYNENLFPEITKYLGDYKLFIEQNDFPTGDIYQLGDKKLAKEQVSVCWKRGEPLTELIKEIKDYDPDIIFISHEWGLFPNARYWLTFLSQLSNYRIIVVLHSIFPTHMDKTICEAAIPEIVVHSEGAKKALKEKGIQNKIDVVEHGCYTIISQAKLWNMYKSEHTFIQSGFGFHYKGLPTSIKAAAILKEKYSDVFLTILFSESEQNKIGHQTYYDSLMRLAETLGIKNNIAIIRGFQSDKVIDAYYRTNAIGVFPYEISPGHMVFGASGAIRLAASKGLPVISSNIPHFDGFPSIKINNEQELANEIYILFANPNRQAEQIAKQNKYIKENSWNNVAQKYLNIFEGVDI